MKLRVSVRAFYQDPSNLTPTVTLMERARGYPLHAEKSAFLRQALKQLKHLDKQLAPQITWREAKEHAAKCLQGDHNGVEYLFVAPQRLC